MKKSIKFLFLEVFILVILVKFNNKFLLALAFIGLHELVHILVGRLYGIKLNEVNFGLSGASAKFVDFDQVEDFKKFIIYLSGPLFNLFVGVIFYLISFSYLNEYIELIYKTNFALFFFNVLPAYPLDGSRMLEIFLSNLIHYRKSKKIIMFISYFISGLFILGFLILFFKYNNLNFTILLVGILFIYSSILEKRNTSYTVINDFFRKKKLIKNSKYIENRIVSVFYEKTIVSLISMIDKNKFNTFYILDDDLKLSCIIHEDEIMSLLKEYGNITIKEYLEKNLDK